MPSITLFNAYRSITLEILAQDEGPGSSPVQARVVINVRDINDNAPYLEMTSSNARSHGNLTTWEVTVMEHSPNGTEVGHVSVSDPDTGQGGYVTCSMRQLPDSTRPVSKSDSNFVKSTYNVLI
jgi:protocadherin delta 1